MSKHQIIVEFDDKATQETHEAALDTIQDALSGNGFEHWCFVEPEREPEQPLPCVTIDTSDDREFRDLVARYTKQGYKLVAASTGFVESYDCNYWQAVMVLPEALPQR